MIRILVSPAPTEEEAEAFLGAFPFGEAEKNKILAKKHPQAKLRSVGGFMALAVLMTEAGLSPESFEVIRLEKGKPVFAGEGTPAFSISHSGELVSAALSTASSPIGVDIEEFFDREKSLPLAERFFSKKEARRVRPGYRRSYRFTRYWTRKEALAKQTGEGLIALFAEGKRSIDLIAADKGLRLGSLRLDTDLSSYQLSLCHADDGETVSVRTLGENIRRHPFSNR